MLLNGLPGPDRWRSAIEAMSLEEWGPTFSVFVATTAGEIFETHDGGDNWREIGKVAPVSKGDHAFILNRAA